MERLKQGGPRTLRGLLLGYLIQTMLACGAELMLWFLVQGMLFNSGFVLPAYTMEKVTAQAVEALSESGRFSSGALPPCTRWMLLESAAPDAAVLDTNMTGACRSAAAASVGEVLRWSASPEKMVRGRPAGGYSQYYRMVWLEDGTVCLFQFDYRVQYADLVRQQQWPDFQYTAILLLAALLVLTVTLTTRRAGRLLKRETDRLTAACDKIAAHQPQDAEFTGAGIREFDEALGAMQTLSQNLADSLRAQWQMEQQRADRMTQLAHELKAPLAVIQGNAELLAEEPLTDAQRQQTEAILRGSARALTAVAHLRRMGLPDTKNKP